MPHRWLLALLPLAIAACSLGGGTSSTPARSTPRASASASATARVVGTTRTVLAQLGLNMHSSPSTSASIVGVLGQGAQVTVLDYQSSNGGWFKVQGASVSGWIVADPGLSALGALTSYTSDTRGFSALYPQNWTFAEETNDTLFRPQSQGMQSIVVRTGANTVAFGSPNPNGYAETKSDQVIVCGYTGQLNEYQRSSATAATPMPGSSAQFLSRYAEIRLTFDAAHAMSLAYNYDSATEFDAFTDFYSSISFPYPLCQAPQSPAPAPT